MVEDQEQQADAVAPVPRKKRRGLMIGLLLVVLAAGVGGYLWYARGAGHTADTAATKAPKTEFYLALDPAFVVNFREDDTLRYLQVGITLMAYDMAAIDTAKNAQPVIRDAMVALLSSQDYKVIGSTAGRLKLQADALAAVRKVVQARLGRPGIDALYFTSYVMQ